jgi:hypothetical protein
VSYFIKSIFHKTGKGDVLDMEKNRVLLNETKQSFDRKLLLSSDRPIHFSLIVQK